MIGRGALRHLGAPIVALPVDAEQPVDAAVACDRCGALLHLALALRIPLVEQAVEDRSLAALAVLAAGGDVVDPETGLVLLRGGAADLAEVNGQIPVIGTP